MAFWLRRLQHSSTPQQAGASGNAVQLQCAAIAAPVYGLPICLRGVSVSSYVGGLVLAAGLVIVALADILVFRFLFRISILETLGWVAFGFLQARPRHAAPPCNL